MSAEKKSKSVFANQRTGVVNTNTLMRRKNETEEAFYKRMTVRGWLGFDKTDKPGHWAPGTNEYHAGSQNDCHRCSGKKVEKVMQSMPSGVALTSQFNVQASKAMNKAVEQDVADKIDMIEEKSEHQISHAEAKAMVEKGEKSSKATQKSMSPTLATSTSASKTLPVIGDKNVETSEEGKLSKGKRTRKKATKKSKESEESAE